MKLPPSAKKAITRHISRVVARLDPARYHQEPVYVAALFARLDEVVYQGRDLTIEFKSTVVDDRGPRSAESVWGADFGIVAMVRTLDESVAKAAIGQAKRGNLGSLVGVERERFRAQVVKMEHATTATLALEVPTMAGELPQIRQVFSREIPLPPDKSSATHLYNDLIFPRDSREPSVILGGRLSLDDYICHELIYCLHGDRRQSFVQALESSTLATLSVNVSGRIAEQANEADEAR